MLTRQTLQGLVFMIQITVAEIRVHLLTKERDELAARNQAKSEQISYLCEVLNRENVELDEFDLIALPSIKQEEK